METLFSELYKGKLYKVEILDRNYTSWNFYPNILGNDSEPVELPNVHPAKYKLFNGDTIMIEPQSNQNQEVTVVHPSRFRSSETIIAGVLDLKSNKTYGRHPKNNKLLYKVVPDDPSLPTFLVPYEIKKVGFSKKFQNMFVTFVFVDWSEKHPLGSLLQTIGPVDVLENFYEYRLSCKNLNHSIQRFTKECSTVFKKHDETLFIHNILAKYPSIEDRRGETWSSKMPKASPSTFSIDPNGSVDFDDAFYITKMKMKLKEDETDVYFVSIYISNVTIWLDVMNLWEVFSERTSTIYLPDKKRTMLPAILSDYLCSLQENTSRFAFSMNLIIDASSFEILSTSFSNCVIRVQKNYTYEEPGLLKNPNYMDLLELTKQMIIRHPYTINIDCGEQIKDSHDVVSYWMIFMNHHCAKKLLSHKNGIFRRVKMQHDLRVDTPIANNVPKEMSNFLQGFNMNSSGSYICLTSSADMNVEELAHDGLNVDVYVHMTSPIRRIVDLLNMIQFQTSMNMISLSEKSIAFYVNWTTPESIDYINSSHKYGRKVQNECELLEKFTNHPENLEKEYDGYVVDVLIKNKSKPAYVVYLPELNTTLKIKPEEQLEKYKAYKCKIYVFNDEDALKKKIQGCKLN